MDFIRVLYSLHYITNPTDLSNLRRRITSLHVDIIFRFQFSSLVVTVVWNVTGAIFDEVIIRIETRTCSGLSCSREELSFLPRRHIQIDCFEQPARNKPAAEIAQDRIVRVLPLLDMKNKI